MTREVLEWIRMAVPGTLVIVLASSLLLPDYDPLQGWHALNAAKSGVALGALVVGVIINILGVRRYILVWTWATVNGNIRRQLLGLVPAAALAPAAAALLAGDDRLMQVFYHFVDKDPSLVNKRDAVYTNGAVLSSSADVILVSLLGVVAHLFVGLLNEPAFEAAWLIVFSLAFLIALAVLAAARRKHLRLSNDQLAYIGVHYRQQVADKVAGLLDVARPGAGAQ